MSDLIYPHEAARKLGMTEAALRTRIHRRADSIPPPFKLGDRWVWRRTEFDAWLEEMSEKHRMQPAGRPGRPRVANG